MPVNNDRLARAIANHRAKLKGEPRPIKPRALAATPPLSPVLPCVYRSEQPVGEVPCKSCAGTVQLKVFGCTKHGRCTIGKPIDGAKCCGTCGDNPAKIK